MELPRVHNQLCRHANALQCLVHLLSADQSHIEIFVPAHEERWRFDPLHMEERIRQLDVRLWILPWRTQLVVIRPDVLVRPIHAARPMRPRSSSAVATAAPTTAIRAATSLAPQSALIVSLYSRPRPALPR